MKISVATQEIECLDESRLLVICDAKYYWNITLSKEGFVASSKPRCRVTEQTEASRDETRAAQHRVGRSGHGIPNAGKKATRRMPICHFAISPSRDFSLSLLFDVVAMGACGAAQRSTAQRAVVGDAKQARAGRHVPCCADHVGRRRVRVDGEFLMKLCGRQSPREAQTGGRAWATRGAAWLGAPERPPGLICGLPGAWRGGGSLSERDACGGGGSR